MDPIRPPSSTDLIEALASLRSDRRAPRRQGVDPGMGTAAPVLREQLRQIALDATVEDPARHAGTRRRMLHCILAAQWGEGLSSDPMYRDVVATMEKDMAERPEFDRLFTQAIERLVSGPR